MFLNSFNYFRAIAIVLIIAGHALFSTHWPAASLFDRVLVNLLAGGSALFVFISGYLFHHVFYPRFNYPAFLRGKLQTVLAPYLVWTLLAVVYFVFYLGWRPLEQLLFLPYGGPFWDYIYPYLGYVVSGSATQAYWYIPFILLIFALSPLFIRYVRAPLPVQLGLLLASILVAMAIHRPENNLSIPQALFYFAHAYLAGILCSRYRQPIMAFWRGREFWLLGLVLALALLQALWFETSGNFHKPALSVTVPDILLLQKLALALFLMVFLHRFEQRRLVWMQQLANASFALYFIHPFVLERGFVWLWAIFGHSLPATPTLLLMTLLTTAACFALAWLIKRATGRFSRLLIGW
jgi:surface polysaccharide O-acyltransferase-like enzyme